MHRQDPAAGDGQGSAAAGMPRDLRRPHSDLRGIFAEGVCRGADGDRRQGRQGRTEGRGGAQISGRREGGMMSDTYLIWSNEHDAWWGSARNGYHRRIAHAGRYSRAEAPEICKDAMPGRRGTESLHEIPVRLDDLGVML